jgi:hypothetical protein
MQVIPKKRYTLFLQSPCAYACGDLETFSFRSAAYILRSEATQFRPDVGKGALASSSAQAHSG